MDTYKIFLLFVLALAALVTSCSSDEPSEEYKYYLTIQSQVTLNLSDDAEGQGGMADPNVDVLSKAVSRMQKAVNEVEAMKGDQNARESKVITKCDSIYKDYTSSHPENRGKVVCFVKIIRSKVINGISREGTGIKNYYFWAEVNDEPNGGDPKEPPTFNLDKPEGLAGVDLGLSVLWASCNMGAALPLEYGGYFAWGDSTGALWSGKGISMNSGGYTWNTSNYGGNTPPTDISGTELDVVAVHWGDGWRMPTQAEARELCSQCEWKLKENDNVKWYEVIGPNGNSIVVPLGGIYGDEPTSTTRFMEGPFKTGLTGYYWTSTSLEEPYNTESSRGYAINSGVATAWTFICASSRGDLTGKNMFLDHLRAFHISIRPVHDK